MRSAFLAEGAAPPRPTLIAPPSNVIPFPLGRRVQRSRRKGVPLPENTQYVGRPTRWSNPFAGRQWGHAKSVILHERWLDGRIAGLSLERMGFDPGEIAALDRLRIWVLTNLHQLAGKDLACWCSLKCKWCHANTLLRLAPIHAEYERFAA